MAYHIEGTHTCVLDYNTREHYQQHTSLFGPVYHEVAAQCKKCVVIRKMASNVEAPESWYLALLGFAEHFRTSSPPKIRLCVHCLQAVFQFKPPQRVEARTHLQLGSVLYHHTKNSELARSHLEKAVSDLLERPWM